VKRNCLPRGTLGPLVVRPERERISGPDALWRKAAVNPEPGTIYARAFMAASNSAGVSLGAL